MRSRCPPGGGPPRWVRGSHRRHHDRRRSLQLRLFVWAGATILVTGLVVSAVGWATSSGPSSWQRTMRGALVLGARRFGDAWDDDRARAALAAEVAAELEVGVTTRDAAGRTLETFGPTTTRRFASIPILVDGTPRGTVEVYASRFRRPHEVVAPLAVAFLVLWGLSGLLARRLARPLADLAQTADALGRGELDRRTRVARHAPIEVARVAEAIDDMAARIQRMMADQRELLAAVSHEVRSPLARIRLLVEMARPGGAPAAGDTARDDTTDDDPARHDAAHALAEIDREVVEIDALVGSLLASSRLDFGTVEPRAIDAVAAARDALRRADLPADRLDVEGSVPVRADPTLLARALANLIDNARVHGGGVVRLGVRTDGDTARFEVDDDGPGVGDDPERLFLPFHRTPGTHGALGLGLAIVARIAEAHGGGAWAENRAPRGARVGFWIPAAASTPAAENAARGSSVG